MLCRECLKKIWFWQKRSHLSTPTHSICAEVSHASYQKGYDAAARENLMAGLPRPDQLYAMRMARAGARSKETGPIKKTGKG